MTWRIEYDNDTGPGDEGFWQWWTVTNGTRSFKCDSEDDAKWLCDFLNRAAAMAPTGEKPPTGKEKEQS
jgi:hypothetical protein